MKRIGSVAVGSLLLLSAIACSSGPSATGESLGSTKQAVISGENSDETQDEVVLIISFDGTSGAVGECTGSLIAPNLVLTARHCVSKTDEGAACDEKGNPIGSSSKVYSDKDPKTLYIFTGPKRPNFDRSFKANGQGAKTFTTGAKTLCNSDIALILLKEPIEGAKLAKLRLDSEAEKKEVITAVGWGITDKTDQPPVRQQRSGVKIIDVGPSSQVAPNEFMVGESICSGDSGGPALSAKGAILGVVSRGGNGQQASGAAACVGGFNLYTKVSSFKDLIVSALEEAGAEPWLEDGPDPRLAKFGANCTEDAECRSSMCHLTSGAGVCTQACDDSSPCPDDYTCSEDKCVAKGQGASSGNNGQASSSSSGGGSSSGCVQATGSGNTTAQGPLGLLLAALGLTVLRGARRRNGSR